MQTQSGKKYLKKFLSIAPISVAVWRSVEAKYLATVPLKEPTLDIGCGFGEFAKGFFDKKIDTGIDIAKKDLENAKKTNKYKNLVLGDARKMPFKDNAFNSVFSISTFEHIIGAEKVINEAYRVLRPNGIFAVTIETTKVDQSIFFRQQFKKIGLEIACLVVIKLYNKMFHRHVLTNSDVWKRHIKKAGFVIERSEDIISPSIVFLYNLFMITSWPSQIPKIFIGRRIVYRPRFITNLLAKFFVRFVDEEISDGTNLFIVARKPRRLKLSSQKKQ